VGQPSVTCAAGFHPPPPQSAWSQVPDLRDKKAVTNTPVLCEEPDCHAIIWKYGMAAHKAEKHGPRPQLVEFEGVVPKEKSHME
jgi:hypothetical protein